MKYPKHRRDIEQASRFGLLLRPDWPRILSWWPGGAIPTGGQPLYHGGLEVFVDVSMCVTGHHDVM